MPARRKPRRIACVPPAVHFKPCGVPLRELEEVQLDLEEVEALRLADLEGLAQDAVGERLGISRATAGRLLESARRKTAEALVHGKALRLLVHTPGTELYGEGVDTMQPDLDADPIRDDVRHIIFPTSDDAGLASTLSHHFGRAPFFTSVTTRRGVILDCAVEQNPYAVTHRPGRVPRLIRERRPHAVVACGMGQAARQALEKGGIELGFTEPGPLVDALKRYLSGQTSTEPRSQRAHVPPEEGRGRCHHHGHGAPSDEHRCGHGHQQGAEGCRRRGRSTSA